MKIVSPYKPIEPFMEFHKVLAAEGFDWLEAVRMLAYSAKVNSNVDTFVITNADLPVPHYRYETTDPKLMLWILEIALAYIESDDFDQNTIFVSPDCLVMKPLNMFGGFDIAVTARLPKYTVRLMNGLQWWPVNSKAKLAALYRECIAIYHTLPEAEKEWGGDTTPLVRLLGPIEAGMHDTEFGSTRMTVKVFPWPTLSTIPSRKSELNMYGSHVVDFKLRHKHYMRQRFVQEFGRLP